MSNLPFNEMRVLQNPCREDEVFVFGSNLAGRHGKGAALWARQNKGAIYGKGIGRQGMSYGIPTKSESLNVLPLTRINQYIQEFLQYARNHDRVKFYVTRIGCGLAGFKIHQIKPLFNNAPDNCRFDW